MAMAHATHAMNGSSAGFGARAVSDTLHRARVTSADVSGAFAMNTAALAVDGLGVLRV